MINLKEIIRKLETSVYREVESGLQLTQGDNFLVLLRSYRESENSDDTIRTELGISRNSFYALKSRLHDKIERALSGNVTASSEELIDMLDRIPEMCYGQPVEIAQTFLLSIERELLSHDMHGELQVVYSALKKIHLYSDKYYHYSKLYNQQVAFALSLEKADELLGLFNRSLGQYIFHPTQESRQQLVFIRSGISDHLRLNPSRRIELRKLLIEIQERLFCNDAPDDEIPDLIKKLQDILQELPASVSKKHFEISAAYLAFEYFIRTRQYRLAARNYSLLSNMDESICLYSHLTVTPLFFISRIVQLQHEGQISELVNCGASEPFVRTGDVFGISCVGIALSMHDFYRKEYKSAARRLNNLINSSVFTEALHLEIDLKITLALVYYKLQEMELAISIVKKLYRKLRAMGDDNYLHVLRICKLLEKQFVSKNKLSVLQKDEYLIFRLKNNGRYSVLRHLIQEFDTLFT